MTGILTRKGKRIDRELFNGQSNRDAEWIDQLSTSPEPFMLRAVVIDVLFDPVSMQPSLEKMLEENEFLNPDELLSAPRNSIIAVIISGANAKRDDTPAVFFPFFSHEHHPIKPGEHVWIFFDDPYRTKAQGYWVTRITAPRDIDDPNYTHMDRRFIDQATTKSIDRFDESLKTLSPNVSTRLAAAAGDGPRFPNGAETLESFTLPDIDGYERINQDAMANLVTTYEPVPRYSKRPADYVIEGSNNSLIVLGEDRTGPSSKLSGKDVSGVPEGDKRGSSGMIDIVVGRGLGPDGMMPQPGTPPKLTQPPTIMNSRGMLETDKSPKNGENSHEGDPDFENDASRLYVSMDTDVDSNFGKELPDLNDSQKPVSVSTGAALVGKSKHVRIIARQDGSVRITKEGILDDEEGEGHGGILIEPDGTIMIDSPQIIIGSGIEKANGEGQQVFVGRDASEPMVLGETLKDLLTTYSSAIDAHISAFATTLAGPSGIVGPGGVGNFGLPLPGMPIIAAQANLLSQSIKTATQQFQTDLVNILSKVGKTK